MHQQRRWSERIIELVVALILLGIVVQVLVSYLIALMPFIIGGLVALGVGAVVIRRYRQW